MLFTCILWSVDLYYKKNSSDPVKVGKIQELFKTVPTEDATAENREDAHAYDWVPIGMLAISLGTVYAFYPSIAPYSLIDFQYASVIELWILFISAIPPLLIAILDTCKIGPSGTVDTVQSSGNQVDFTNQTISFDANQLEVKHNDKTEGTKKVYHLHSSNSNVRDGLTSDECQAGTSHSGNTAIFHAYKSSTYQYSIQTDDKYWDKDASGGQGAAKTLSANETITFTFYHNWFQKKITTIDASGTYSSATYTQITKDNNPPTGILWNLIWLCAIFYILCIQIFMSMLHYPDCLLSCFFNNHPYVIGFISVLFNTVRETLQACGFSGAGKQCTNHNGNNIPTSNGNITFDKYTITDIKTSTEPSKLGQVLLTNNTATNGIPVSKKDGASTASDITSNAEFRLKAGSTVSFKIPKSKLSIILILVLKQ